jgi:hypothetical protein
MRRIPERSLLRIRARLLDPDDVPTVPNTLRYRLDCQTTSTVLIGWTEVTPTSLLEVSVPADMNRIINTRNRVERKVFTVDANTGTTEAYTVEEIYEVKNLSAVT